ncbi:MAG: BON domain-containing protein [Nitrospirales bacterium]
MTVRKKQTITFGAIFLMSVGLPFLAQAGSGHGSSGYPDNGYQERYDSQHRYSQDRHDRDFYTDQYGDLDTDNDKDRHARSYRGNQSFQTHSSSSSRDPELRNELRRSDEQLRRDIVNRLGDDTDRVRVRVRNGVATLTGMVENREAMVSAVDSAYEGGAQKVRNKLEVFRLEDRPWSDMSDRTLAKAVREEISWSPYAWIVILSELPQITES